MIINGLTFDFSIYDADDVERFEKCNSILEEGDRNRPEGMTEAEAIRYGCKLFIEFFDGMFGDGTSARLFSGKTNYAKCLDAYYDFLDGIEAESNEQKRIQIERDQRYGAQSWRSPN